MGLTDLAKRRRAADDEGGRAGVCGLALGRPDGLEAEGEVLRSGRLVVEGQDIGGERERKRCSFLERDVVRDLEGDVLVALVPMIMTEEYTYYCGEISRNDSVLLACGSDGRPGSLKDTGRQTSMSVCVYQCHHCGDKA